MRRINYDCLRGLSNLRTLLVNGVSFDDWNLLKGDENLEWLSLGSQARVQSLESLTEAAPFMRRLDLYGCDCFLAFKGINLRWLTILHLQSCSRLGSVDVSALEDLVEVFIRSCGDFQTVHVGSRVIFVDVVDCSQRIFIDLSGVTALERMAVGECVNLHMLQLPEQMASLRELALSQLPAQRSLDLRSCDALEDLALEHCASIEVLQLPAELLTLKKLSLWSTPARTELDLRTCASLVELTLTQCPGIPTLQLPVRPVSFMKFASRDVLIHFEIDLQSCMQLRWFTLWYCPLVEELRLPLDMTRIAEFSLQSCPAHCQVDLSCCMLLDFAHVHDCPGMASLRLPTDLEQVSHVTVRGLPAHCTIHPDTRAALLERARRP